MAFLVTGDKVCVRAHPGEAGGLAGGQTHHDAFLVGVVEACGPGQVPGVGLPWCC